MEQRRIKITIRIKIRIESKAAGGPSV